LISIQTFGESFGGLASYLETGESRVDPAPRVGWMEFLNLPTERMDVAVPIMQGTASLSGTQQPVFHLSINWAPGEPVNRELMHAVMVQTLSDLGLREHQAVIVEHIDTECEPIDIRFFVTIFCSAYPILTSPARSSEKKQCRE
jgi:hypothetical protein